MIGKAGRPISGRRRSVSLPNKRRVEKFVRFQMAANSRSSRRKVERNTLPLLLNAICHNFCSSRRSMYQEQRNILTLVKINTAYKFRLSHFLSNFDLWYGDKNSPGLTSDLLLYKFHILNHRSFTLWPLPDLTFPHYWWNPIWKCTGNRKWKAKQKTRSK